MAKFFVISEADRPDLRRMLDDFKSGNFPTTDDFINALAEVKANIDREDTLIGKFAQEVPARDANNKAGEGELTVWDLVRKAQSDAVLEATTRKVRVYNFTGDVLEADKFAWAERHYKSGLWICGAFDCAQ